MSAFLWRGTAVSRIGAFTKIESMTRIVKGARSGLYSSKRVQLLRLGMPPHFAPNFRNVTVDLEGESARGFEASASLSARLRQAAFAASEFCFGHFTSTCFGVCFGHVLAKVSPREVLRLLPRSRVAFFCVRFL